MNPQLAWQNSPSETHDPEPEEDEELLFEEVMFTDEEIEAELEDEELLDGA